MSIWCLTVAGIAAAPSVGTAQMASGPNGSDVLTRIRQEGFGQSRLDTMAQQLLDGIGPRLTGSMGLRRAQEWAITTLRQWGIGNPRLEWWDSTFGRGWERGRLSVRMTEPYVQSLRAEPAAWSGSTQGNQACTVVLIDPADSLQWGRHRGRLSDACVLWEQWNPVGPEFDPKVRRYSADSLLEWSSRTSVTPMAGPSPQQVEQQRRQAALMRFFRAERPVALLRPPLGGWTYGVLRTGVHPDGIRVVDSVYEPVPALFLSHEQYGQLWRLSRRGVLAKLEIDMQNRWGNPDRREANLLADLPGTDLADEQVIIGGHFDSWHSGQGAADNAAGSLVMMEAMRILKQLNQPLRRTVRLALWSGEEQGLFGSRHYVRMHAAELSKVSAYLNIDYGAGRLRGVWGQGNLRAMQVLDQILFPVRDLGIGPSSIDNIGGTDHLMFDRAGVPAFQFIQDPLEYQFRTHHSSTDTYERLVLEDLQQAAVVVAWMAYVLATRDDPLPRKVPPPSAR
jgi:hypothetical protein